MRNILNVRNIRAICFHYHQGTLLSAEKCRAWWYFIKVLNENGNSCLCIDDKLILSLNCLISSLFHVISQMNHKLFITRPKISKFWQKKIARKDQKFVCRGNSLHIELFKIFKNPVLIKHFISFLGFVWKYIYIFQELKNA